MKHLFPLVAGLLIGAFWAGCNCGPGPGACLDSTECAPGHSCVANICTRNPTDGGTDGGNGGNDGGNDGGGGGGSDGGRTDGGGGGSDAGRPDAGCVNLQCQQVTCPGGGTTTLTGKIYDPSGTVPLYNALVYVPNGPVEPFTTGVSCDQCGALTTGSPLVITLTGADGSFRLENVPVGNNIPLVFQIGRWRRQVTLSSVPSCTTTPITDVNILRMPRNKSEGDIPLMAIASGSADPFECLLRKMGISDSEFTAPSGGGRVHYYVQNGNDLAQAAPRANTLWTDGGTLLQYDVVMLPCEGAENRKPSYATQNIINYTSQGGRVFTTHYGYVWLAFAQQPFPSTADWQPDKEQLANPPNPYNVTINQSFPKGAAFAEWLVNVGASADAGMLPIRESRRDVVAANPPISTAWMSGQYVRNSTTYRSVPHLTFNTPVNPAQQADGGTAPQCGRVVFSDFHVSVAARADPNAPFPDECKVEPLSPQEKALVFMLYDLSSCIQKDDAPPTTCSTSGQTCANDNGCCQGLACTTSNGGACTSGASCTCTPVIR